MAHDEAINPARRGGAGGVRRARGLRRRPAGLAGAGWRGRVVMVRSWAWGRESG